MDEKRNIAKAAGKTSAGTIVSRVTGLIREIVITWAFGASGITDAFFVAFRIPNLLREFFAEGSVSAGFVPVFTEYLTKEGKEEAKRLAGIVLAFLLSVLIIVCLAGIIFAPYIVAVFAPGFKPDPEKFSLTVKL
ncbi:MAG: murein biosynthesis integral membrane protein MurJ, partial [Candidatus Mariimomonas ferrooxydans]